MCYNTEAGCRRALKYAMLRGDEKMIDMLLKRLKEFERGKIPLYHVSGFAHPKLMVFTNLEPFTPQHFTWGLIPAWTKTLADAKKLWNNTLNARGETIFEKPAFRTPAKLKRCLIYLDAFYEHHHANGRTYPFRISMKDDSPMAIAGLWDEWVDTQTGEIYLTTTIVTTEANPMMTRIHNNPKAEGPRMPVILPKERQDEWLIDYKSDEDKKHLQSLIKPFDETLLKAHTVGPLLGKNAMANTVEAEREVVYADLDLTLT